MKWENVYIFISSTFNDMHAERDILIKRAFPELREWCAKRKLRLIDIDLRWGVSEEDARENRKAVEICLNNIDRCRPFFLFFLGQRRGWVPGINDINPATLEAFPKLKPYIGSTSVTEMEIIHALLEPMREGVLPVRHIRGYFRDPACVQEITDDTVRGLYVSTGNTEKEPGREKTDGAEPDGKPANSLEAFKAKIAGQCRCVLYQADWAPDRISHELESVAGGIYKQGRFEHFRVGGEPMEADVLQWLKEEIAAEFPEHMPAENGQDGAAESDNKQSQTGAAGSDKKKPQTGTAEIDEQETAIFQAYDVYIPRREAEDAVLGYAADPGNRCLVLRADPGSGKTSLLSHLYLTKKFPGKVYMRLAGTTAGSMTGTAVLRSILTQMCADGLLKEKEIAHPDHELPFLFPELLRTAALTAANENTAASKEGAAAGTEDRTEAATDNVTTLITVIVDGINQFKGTAEENRIVPAQLPDGVSMIVSTVSGEEAEKAEETKEVNEAQLPDSVLFHDLSAMSSEEDRRTLITEYMGMFLKNLDEEQIRRILAMPGSSNPLYLKIVLHELRQFGSFDALMEKLSEDYGRTPREAACEVLRRIFREAKERSPREEQLLIRFLMMMAWSNGGIPRVYTAKSLKRSVFREDEMTQKDLEDLMMGTARELAPYLSYGEEAMDFRYESFRLAMQDLLGGSEEEARLMLGQLYLMILSDRPEDRRAAQQLCWQIVRKDEETAVSVFGNANILLAILKAGAAEDVAEAMEYGAAENYSGFGQAARFFRIHAADLTVNPYTLFDLLQEADWMSGCPFVPTLLQSEKRNEPRRRLRDLYPDPYEKIMTGSYALPTDADFIDAAGDWLVIVSLPEDRKGIRVRVADLMTGRTRQTAYYRDLVLSECRMKLSGDQMILYSEGKKQDAQLRILRLPDLQELERLQVTPPKSGTAHLDALHVYAGVCYGYYKDYGDSIYSDQPDPYWDTALLRLNDSRILRESRRTRESAAFADRYLVIGDNERDAVRLFDLTAETDALVLDDPVPDPPEKDAGISVFNEINVDTVEGDGWILVSDGVSLRDRRTWKIGMGEDAPVVLKEAQTDYFLQHAQYAGGEVFVRQGSSVAVLDPDLGIRTRLSYPIENKGKWSGRIVLRGNTIMILQDDRLTAFDRDSFMAGGREGKRLPHDFSAGVKMFFQNGRLYIFNVPLIAASLEEPGEIIYEEDAQNKFSFEPALKAPGSSLLYGVISNNNALCLKDIAAMKKLYVSVLENGVGQLEHVYEDRGLAWAVKSGILPEKHRSIAREYSDEPEEASFGKVQVQSIRASYADGKLRRGVIEDTWQPEGEVLMMPYKKATRVVQLDGEYYLFIINIYVDETDKRFRVYRMSDRKLLIQYRYSGMVHILEDFIVTRRGKLLFFETQTDDAGERRQFLIEYDLRTGKGRALKTPAECYAINSGKSRNQAIDGPLWDSDYCVLTAYNYEGCPDGALLIYHTEEHRVSPIIPVAKKKRTDLVGMAILHDPEDEKKGTLLLGCRKMRQIEAYDLETGRFLFRQRVDGDPEEIIADAATGSVAISGLYTDQRLYRMM